MSYNWKIYIECFKWGIMLEQFVNKEQLVGENGH